ncbi:MAG: class III extradiol ring-cleavage dioxygenase, partial [Myxococcota bacterium]
MTRERLPTAFIPHGGGPWPLMPLPGMPNEEATALRGYMESIARVPSAAPRALLVVSAHWEAEKLTVNSGAAPGMLYDYGGFPQEAYELQWPAPGHPAVATEVRQRLERAGFATDEDAERGFDHGVFIPLLAAFPAPSIPVVQLSLKRGLDPAEHLSIGRALAPLRDDGVFIVGSGNSFHNLRAFFRERTSAMKAHSEAFD